MENAFLNLAVERRTDEELAQFYDLCCEFNEKLRFYYSCEKDEKAQESFSRTVEIAEELHRLLCEMTHNPLLVYAFTLCQELLWKHIEFNAKKRISDVDENLCNIWGKRWFQFYEALKEQDVASAHRLLEQIID